MSGLRVQAALAAGASDDEIIGVLAIVPVAGLGRVTGAVPGVAAALGYDVEAALLDPDDHSRPSGARRSSLPAKPAGRRERGRLAAKPRTYDSSVGVGQGWRDL